MSDFTQCETCVYFIEEEEGCAVSFDEVGGQAVLGRQ